MLLLLLQLLEFEQVAFHDEFLWLYSLFVLDLFQSQEQALQVYLRFPKVGILGLALVEMLLESFVLQMPVLIVLHFL